MIVQGTQVFPLNLVSSKLNDYFMDKANNVYSTKADRGRLVRLNGSKSGQVHYYTLGGTTHKHPDLVKKVQAHSDYVKHLGLLPAACLPVPPTTPGWPFPSKSTASASASASVPVPAKLPLPPAAPLTGTAPRAVKSSTDNSSIAYGIQKSGSVIATLTPTGLSIPARPVVYFDATTLKDELERLARQTPGVEFIALKITGSVKTGGLAWTGSV